MSIEGRIRIACAVILGLTIAVLLIVARTTRNAERVNGVIAVATMVAVEQDGFDERLRRVRTAIGDATRAAEKGGRPRPEVWTDLRRSLSRLRQPAHEHDRVLPVERGKAIAVRLAGEGYAVQYGEFDGAHLVSPPLAHAALRQMSER